jgi:hypothetical protein
VDIATLARELHLHRTTLYARNRRLQERYGLAWDKPEDRLATIIGMRLGLLHRLHEVSRPPAGSTPTRPV